MQIKRNLNNTVNSLKTLVFNSYIGIGFFNSVLILFQFFYINLRFEFLNERIPLWYTRPWGDYQLAPKLYIYVLPAVSIGILLGGFLILFLLHRFFARYLLELVATVTTVSILVVTAALVKIIFSASTPFEPLIDPNFLDYALPFLAAFFLMYFLVPQYINLARNLDIVTNPSVHSHPAMVLKSPAVRGAGVVFAGVFLAVSVYFIGFRAELMGFYVSLFMLALLGFVDDYQNTHPRSGFRVLENPALRLVLLFSAVSVVVISGIRFATLPNPAGGVINLDFIKLNLDSVAFPIISSLVTIIWIVWIMNLLSWSNGIDGQYAGIIGISSIIIGILALRFSPLEPTQKSAAIMAYISAGAAFGAVRYSWHPSKILWGFGAVSAGMIIAVLSIFIQSKVTVSILIILVPFIDAVVTFARRLLQRKNPLAGDRGHLHHLLLARNWSVPSIALFYWGTTALFGGIALAASEKYTLQVAMTLIGLVAFIIALLNLKSLRRKPKQQ